MITRGMARAQRQGALPVIFRVSPVIIFLGLATLAHAQAISRPDVPDKIKALAGEKLVLLARGSGSQIYVCQQVSSGGQPQWVLKAPEAVLRDAGGAVIGHHYAGPTWKNNDGSVVSGKAVAQVDSPNADSIPWLLLTATGHSGSGVFARVETIQRIHTKGGAPPPASDCDASRLNAEKKTNYTADYYFYVSGD